VDFSQVDALGNSSIKPRSKRAVIGNASKLSFKDLALKLAKIHLLKTIAGEQYDLQKAKESLYILQKGLVHSLILLHFLFSFSSVRICTVLRFVEFSR